MDISVGILMTASALLGVVLLVWAQLWINTNKIDKDKQENGNTTANESINASTNLVLTWTYLALLFALIAFACITLSVWGGETWKKLGIGSLGISFSMLMIEVLISLLCTGFKYWNNKKFDQPCRLSLDKRLSRYLLIGLPVCFAVFSLCAAFSRNYWFMFGNLLMTIIAAIIILEVFHRRNDQPNDTE